MHAGEESGEMWMAMGEKGSDVVFLDLKCGIY